MGSEQDADAGNYQEDASQGTTSITTNDSVSTKLISLLMDSKAKGSANSNQDGKHPGELTRMMSPSHAKQPFQEVTVEGRKYTLQNNMSKILYRTSQANSKRQGALIDRGSNGGVAGSDCRVMYTDPIRTVDVEGIDNHQINDVRIVTCGAYAETNKGPVILIFNQYANAGKGKTIHSSAQLEWFGNKVCDRSKKVGGKQEIVMPSGHILPIAIRAVFH